MIRRKRPPPMLIIPHPQPLPFATPLPHKSHINTTPPHHRLIPPRPMRQHTPKKQHVTRTKLHRNPLVGLLPASRDAAALRERNIHPVRPRHNLQTAIGDGGVVDGDVGCEVCDGRDVAVGVVVDVGVEAVAVGEFVVDFVFEEGCFLFLS